MHGTESYVMSRYNKKHTSQLMFSCVSEREKSESLIEIEKGEMI
jgi:hypothetical protein